MIDNVKYGTHSGWKPWAAVLLAALMALVAAVAVSGPADSATRARISVSP